MKHPIAIAFSDFHTAKWKQFNDKNQRTLQPYDIINIIINKTKQLNVPLLFAGDWNDHPKHMDNQVMQVTAAIAYRLTEKNVAIIGIDGNHDFDKVNTIKVNARGFFSHLSVLNPNFICVNFKYYDTFKARIHGIPYINGNADYKKAIKEAIKNRAKDKQNILMIHRDLPGAVEPNGISIGDMEDAVSLKKYFKKFDLVLSGHIHKPQWVKKLGKNVLMLGATNHQRRSDAGTKMGYWILYSNNTAEFVDLKQPEFRYYKDGEEPKNDYDYWIKLPPEPIVDKADTKTHKFNSGQKRDKLVKNYMKVKNIKSKAKLNLLMKLIND